MRIAVAADERVGIAGALIDELRRRGHEPIAHGALADDERDDWAWATEAAARDLATGKPSRRSSAAGPGPGRRSPRTRSAEFARRSASTRRRPTAPAAGTTPTAWRSACGRPPRPSSARFSTRGSPAGRATPSDDRANVEHLAEIEDG